MAANYVATQIEQALEHARAGDLRRAASALSPLSVPLLELQGEPLVPTAQFAQAYLAEGRRDEAVWRLEAMLKVYSAEPEGAL